MIGPPGVVLLVDVTPGTGVFGVTGLAVPCFPVVLVSPVGNRPVSVTIPTDVGVVGLELLGVVGLEPLGVVDKPTFKPAGKAIANVPGVVGVSTFTGLTPGVVGVVGVVTPGVSTPVTVRTVSVEGFFIALIDCRICETFVQRRRPMLPNSFSNCSGESGGRRILSNTPGQCFYNESKINMSVDSSSWQHSKLYLTRVARSATRLVPI